MIDAGRFETEPLHIGRASRRHQYLVRREPIPPLTRSGMKVENFLFAAALHPLSPRVEHDLQPLAEHGFLQDRGRVSVLAVEEVRLVVQQKHLAPQSLEGLGQLAADRPAADDRQTRRALGQREHRLVGQETDLFQPRDGWSRRSPAGGDHSSLEAQRSAVDFHRAAAHEAAVTEEHIHPEIREPPNRVVMADAGPHTPHALHDGGEIDLRRPRYRHAELGRPVQFAQHPRRTNQRLRRYAPDVQTIAAHEVAFHQRDSRSQAGGPRRGDEPGCACPDNDQVVTGSGLWVLPIARVNIRQQLGVG